MSIPTFPRYFPTRYQRPAWFDEQFDQAMEAALKPNMRILDLGSGRTPALGVESRPPGCHYVGLDISLAELRKAPADSYDEMFQADAIVRNPALENSFDLVLSYQVLEHVKPFETAFENMIAYLKPGGRLVAQMSGTFSLFGLINQVLPQKLAVWALHETRRVGRDAARRDSPADDAGFEVAADGFDFGEFGHRGCWPLAVGCWLQVLVHRNGTESAKEAPETSI